MPETVRVPNLQLSEAGTIREQAEILENLYAAITKLTLQPGFQNLTDLISFTIQYAGTARAYGHAPDLREGFARRYGENRGLLESDLIHGPVIIKRLGTWAEKLPESSQTKAFAAKNLPAVRKFYENLVSYAEERFTTQQFNKYPGIKDILRRGSL